MGGASQGKESGQGKESDVSLRQQECLECLEYEDTIICPSEQGLIFSVRMLVFWTK